MAQEMLQAREHKESQAHVMLSHVNLDTAIKPVNRTTMKASRKRKGAACSGDAPIQEYNNTVTLQFLIENSLQMEMKPLITPSLLIFHMNPLIAPFRLIFPLIHFYASSIAKSS